MEDPLGYELIVDRKIEAKEIEKIRTLSQKTGWRYFPGSNNKKPACACPVCIPTGSIKGKVLRDKIEPPEKILTYYEAIERLKQEEDEYEIDNLLWTIKRTKRRADPAELLFLLDRKSDSINQSVALALGKFRHKNTKNILLELLKSTDDDTREYAADSLLELYNQAVEQVLSDMHDEAINQALASWKKGD